MDGLTPVVLESRPFMGQQARVNQNLAHAKLAQHEDVFDYTLQQLKRINGNCDALHAGHEALVATVAALDKRLSFLEESFDLHLQIAEAERVIRTSFLGRLRWVFRG